MLKFCVSRSDLDDSYGGWQAVCDMFQSTCFKVKLADYFCSRLVQCVQTGVNYLCAIGHHALSKFDDCILLISFISRNLHKNI